jgi:diketogulonate reductase-like aldo/keto reductase
MPDCPKLLYGTAWKAGRTAELVETAVLAGFRGIDTACQPKHYDEPGVGQALTALAAKGVTRDQLFLQTKFTPLDGQDPARLPYDPDAPLPEQVRQSFAASLKNLGTDYVDSWVLHSPLATLEETLEAWRAMETVRLAGGVRSLGLSNCPDLDFFQALHAAADVKPAVLQNRFQARTGYDAELRAWCRANGIQYQSFWTLTANPHILAHRDVQAAAKTHGKTRAQILFRLLVQQGVVPLTGTTSPKHMAEDLAVLGFELPAPEAAALYRLFG